MRWVFGNNGGMIKEILFEEKDLMTEEELEAWKEIARLFELGSDPLELLGRNRGVNKVGFDNVLVANGRDDGDMLG